MTTIIKPTNDSKGLATHSVASFATKASLIKSKTLMRKYVVKPDQSLKRQTRVSSNLSLDIANPSLIKKRPSLSTKLLKDIAKSPNVTHFNSVVGQSTGAASTVRVTNPAKQQSYDQNETKQEKSRLELMLENGINNSTSHLEKTPKNVYKKRQLGKKIIGISAALSVTLVILALTNINNIKLDVASARSGFSAVLPKNPLSGFKLSSISYGAGFINSIFNNGHSSYTLSQRLSNINNDQLVSYVIKPVSSSYESQAANGKTVYLYSQNQASWVENGYLYTIKANSNLNNHQILDIASSI